MKAVKMKVTIYWKLKDEKQRRELCNDMSLPTGMNVNGLSRYVVNDAQFLALKELEKKNMIQIRKYE